MVYIVVLIDRHLASFLNTIFDHLTYVVCIYFKTYIHKRDGDTSMIIIFWRVVGRIKTHIPSAVHE